MKIRSGFVSNSSSSSFILSYDKSKILSGPEQILEFVKNRPDDSLVFNGGDCCEGDDIFELDDDQKSAIRMFPKEFIEQNSGSKIFAYPGAHLFSYNQYDNYVMSEDVDMSDFGSKPNAVPIEILVKKAEERTPEEKALVEQSTRWFEERSKRATEMSKEKERKDLAEEKERFIKDSNIPGENAVTTIVQVSNNNCGNDFDADMFSERYLSSEDPEIDPNTYAVKKYKKGKPRPYSLIYRDVIENKKDIISFLSSSNEKCYILWVDPVKRTFSAENDLQYDFFEIGPEEKEFLVKQQKEFLENGKKCSLFVDAKIFRDGDIVKPGKLLNLYGKVVIIPQGNDMRDFRRYAVK